MALNNPSYIAGLSQLFRPEKYILMWRALDLVHAEEQGSEEIHTAQ